MKRSSTRISLERLLGEGKRRTKVIPRFPGEAALRLVYATLVKASERWHGVRMTPEILRQLDTDGVELRFGNAEALVQMVEKIARRQGIGAVLAEGCKRAAEQIGHGADELAMHVKGLEIPMHEPRLEQGLGVAYSVAANGADHCVGLHDTMVYQDGPTLEALRSLGAYDPLPVNDLSASKVAMQKAHHLNRLFLDSLVCCSMLPWDMNDLTEIVSNVTGLDFTSTEAMLVGERTATLSRVFNLREGLTTSDDQLPRRFFAPTPRGGMKNTAIDPQAMRNAIQTFYFLMGWDRATGVPTPEKLAELGVGWAASALPR